MLYLFLRKTIFIVKYFLESYFLKKYFASKIFFGVWRIRKITNIFYIFI